MQPPLWQQPPCSHQAAGLWDLTPGEAHCHLPGGGVLAPAAQTACGFCFCCHHRGPGSSRAAPGEWMCLLHLLCSQHLTAAPSYTAGPTGNRKSSSPSAGDTERLCSEAQELKWGYNLWSFQAQALTGPPASLSLITDFFPGCSPAAILSLALPANSCACSSQGGASVQAAPAPQRLGLWLSFGAWGRPGVRSHHATMQPSISSCSIVLLILAV